MFIVECFNIIMIKFVRLGYLGWEELKSVGDQNIKFVRTIPFSVFRLCFSLGWLYQQLILRQLPQLSDCMVTVFRVFEYGDQEVLNFCCWQDLEGRTETGCGMLSFV
eukprot:TRINITY_DN4933_c0_g1_i11.p4 TRINITY_DN4933_c0_g1~~TRINITY_DN4933_c0_g1_i11.p4  ORF type:complete len:107 (-),score=5.34 TRINITY_DN4933_c0_g1_i11:48-368(-)